MQGPLRKDQWGRIWAKAFIDDTFKDKLERSPQDAATAVFGQVQPLFNTRDPNSYARFFFNRLDPSNQSVPVGDRFTEQECKDIRDDKFKKKNDRRWNDLRGKLKGNQFFLWKNGVLLCKLPPQEIDVPKGPPVPLKRDDWVRVYAQAFLDPGFREQLEKDPAIAVNAFTNNPGLNHTPGDRIFDFPEFNELLEVIPDESELQDSTILRETLEKIAKGMPSEYQATLEVTLTC